MTVIQAVKNFINMNSQLILEAKQLAHLGKRAAIDQALSRLARIGLIQRIARGRYSLASQAKPITRVASLEEALKAFGVVNLAGASNVKLQPANMMYSATETTNPLVKKVEYNNKSLRIDQNLAKSSSVTTLYILMQTQGQKIKKVLLEQIRKKLNVTDIEELQENLRYFKDWMIEKIRHWLPKLVV